MNVYLFSYAGVPIYLHLIGAVIPLLVAVTLLVRCGLFLETATITIVSTVFFCLMIMPVEGKGGGLYSAVSLFPAILSYFVARKAPISVAFASTCFSDVASDVFFIFNHLSHIEGVKGGAIGGAGILDGIVIIPITASCLVAFILFLGSWPPANIITYDGDQP